MWIADQWKDYEVIDCSKGEKLERWGKYTLVRPDPQVIWDTPKTERGWKHMNGHYHRSKKGGDRGSLSCSDSVGETKVTETDGLSLLCSVTFFFTII